MPGGAQLGGAPANFAFHASELGADAAVISRVGQDDLGREIVARLRGMGLNTACVQSDPNRPTGSVTVSVDAAGQPTFEIHRDVAWDALDADPAAYRAVHAADAVCFGSLAQRSAGSGAAIRGLVAAAPPAALRIFDMNIRQKFYSRDVVERSLELCNVLKLNDAELPQLAAMFGLRGDMKEQLDQLIERWPLRAIACTRGASGSLIRTREAWSEHDGVPTRVVDTVGAGDAFTAAMTVGMLQGWPLERVNAQANLLASYVASCAGATPPIPASLQASFR